MGPKILMNESNLATIQVAPEMHEPHPSGNFPYHYPAAKIS
jgi:hypothetical protein